MHEHITPIGMREHIMDSTYKVFQLYYNRYGSLEFGVQQIQQCIHL
jgi:hypothetical protein